MALDSQILVAESNNIIATDIQCLLTNWGFNPPDIANSVDKTFESIKHRQPDLIVMGTKLKDNNDCLRLATWINKTYHVPIIVLVVWNDKDVQRQVRNLNSFYCLSEPFDVEELRSLVKKALKERRN
jgi:DNA-binding NtrC family response regulator